MRSCGGLQIPPDKPEPRQSAIQKLRSALLAKINPGARIRLAGGKRQAAGAACRFFPQKFTRMPTPK